MIESQLPLPVTAVLLGILFGIICAKIYVYLQAKELNHVFGYDPDGYPAAASYNTRDNEIVHRFKYYSGLKMGDIEDNIEEMILWAELEELTHWAGHIDVEPDHSNDWLYTFIDVICWLNEDAAWYEMNGETEIIADYYSQQEALENA